MAREPPALVGPPDTDLARGRRERGRPRQGLRRPRHGGLAERRGRGLVRLLVGRVARRGDRGGEVAGARCRRARHLVLVRPLAALHAWLARGHGGTGGLLSNQCARHESRHPHALGGSDGDHGRVRHWRDPVPRGLHPSQDPRPLRRDDEQEQGERRRSRGCDRVARRRRAPVCPGRHGDGDAGRADAGRLSVPGLRPPRRTDGAKPREAADRLPEVPEALPHAVGQRRRGSRTSPRSRREREVRGRSQLLQQALERHAVCADELRGLCRRAAGGRG